MKLLNLFLTLIFVSLAAAGHSQKISLSVKNTPLQNVFKLIEKQTDYRFVYTTEQLQKLSFVSLELRKVTLEKALDECLFDQPLSYTIEEKLVIIYTKKENRNYLLHNVNGIITGIDGQRLAGVTISVKGVNKATISDRNGEFSLIGISPDAILVISRVETEVLEIKVNAKKYISVTLAQKINELDETMVIAYGKTIKRFSTGSVSKITALDISKQPVGNFLAALQGRVPGLSITSTSGLPGASIIVQIRGQNSLNPNPALNAGLYPVDNPLFIIDGVPFAPQNANINQFTSLASPGPNSVFGNPYGGLSPFNSINPNYIESIEVLRGADETAIYGSRGANGVLLITTKKGIAGKTKFNLTISTGQSRITRTMKLLNTQQYLAMRREAFNNDSVVPTAVPGNAGYAPDIQVFNNETFTDWKNYFLERTATGTDINATVSGGSATTNFLIGAGYRYDSYILPGHFGNSRASVITNIRHQSVDRRLLLELATNYSYEQNNSSGSPLLLQAFTLPPNYPNLKDSTGNLNWSYQGVAIENPLGYLRTKYKIQNYNLLSHLQVGYEIISGLTLKTNIGYNNYDANEISQNPKAAEDPGSNPIATALFGKNNFQTWLIEPLAEYNKKINRGKLSVLLGGTFQQNSNSQTQVIGSNYPSDNLLGSISGAGNINSFDLYTQYRYVAVFGRLNFILKNRYIVNATGRRDGSSRFGPGKQFGNFGAIGMAWLMTEEKAIKRWLPLLSYGKLRVSYGKTGGDNILDYQYLSRWAPDLPSYQGTAAYTPQNLYNEHLHWSTNKKLEAAIELGFLNNNLLCNLLWYRHRSGDQIVTYTLPTQTGFRGITANFPALVQNSGWEIQLSSTNFKTSRFSWTTSFNLTIPKNKLLSFSGIENSSYYPTYVVGESLNLLRVFKYAGINSTTGVYQFVSKTGISSSPLEEDKILAGNLDPKFFGGLNNHVVFKNIEFDLFLEFKKQLGANYLQQINGRPPGHPFNQPIAILDRWKSPQTLGSIQKYTTQPNSEAELSARFFRLSDAAYSDASYIRFRNISISWSAQKKLASKLKLEGIRVYINAQNMLTITKYKGNDPETRSFYSLPPLKVIVTGLQFTF